MLKLIQVFLPLLLNSLFAIMSIIYLQLKGQQSYFLYSEVCCLILGAALFIVAQIQPKKKQIQQDHSPVLFIILLLVQFCSLLQLDYRSLTQNILSLLIGGMLFLQKINYTSQQNYIKIKRTKALLQSTTLLFIIILVITSQKQSQYQFVELAITFILVIVFLVIQLLPKKLDKKSQNKIISLTQNSTTQQINSYHLWEKFLEKQILVVSANKNDIVIEKISEYLDQYLKEKNQNIDDYLKNTQIIEISFVNENIILNKMIEVKQSLYQYIKDILNDNQKQKTIPKNLKIQHQFQEDQSSKLMSPKESRSQLSIMFKQDSQSQKICSTNNGNNAIDQSTFEKEFLNKSTKDLSLILSNQLQQSYSPLIQNKFKLLGIYNQEKYNYKKITFNNQNQALILEFEEDNIEQLKIQLNDIQNQYKLTVTKILCQRVSLMLKDLKSKLNQITTQNPDLKRLNQIQSQIYLLNLCNKNILYFLTDDFKEGKQSQLNLDVFLNKIISKLSQDTLIYEKGIKISINNELLLNQTVITYPQFLQFIIVNLIYNSIQQCSKTDSTHSIIINLKQLNNEDIKFEIIDDAGGLLNKLDYSRVLAGKLGIFVAQKLLPHISQYPILKFKTIDLDGTKKGNLVSFQISRHIKEINNLKSYSTQNILNQDIYNVAKLLQSQ
ncbi:unnamed protein product (macronuclear) [Paramecium tetraurelia]|uniref:Chromosome undetermined scaffold_1, whole genome shotgun sequence n=1 Tax=Paramecium tetraurelia TaxID=5888 RepID=Q6BFI1_PARTE|nr:hypothetical protein [Paramecium tetraurelia strain d4-2]XP_001423060.1 uncharacterized protein GSPATT00000097001 [Paramecium tetraurelia]CAH03589.1 hypothetical protein, transmembrane helices [Paramecium tetraurelia]CAK55662.1 unnamed protein product [Paramecium tetraurelia]|eukprot:XP_001423060.1 hypothetical protein (macronuclear) [Paramecium tetraurelia strain d4-2]